MKILWSAALFTIMVGISVLAVANTAHGAVNYSGPCHAAVDQYWPAASNQWAHRIVSRESNGIPTAANKRSSARGCFQLLTRIHARRFTAVGCSPAMWADARCNTLAALNLYQQAGKSPWRL
jgi:hypothetical protein